MQKPHICFVSDSKPTYSLLSGEPSSLVGGAELQQSIIASALRDLGYSVTFVVPDCGQPDKVVTDEGITLINARFLLGGIRGLTYLDHVLRLFRAMKRADADIYYQRIGGLTTGVAALFCKLKRRPFVFSVASNMDLDGTLKIQFRPHYYITYRYGLKRATLVVVQTEDQLRLLKQTAGRDGILIRSTFSVLDRAERQGVRRHVLWVGNLRAVKRPDWLVELAIRLPQYSFVMVGGPKVGEEAMFDRIRAAAREMPNLRVTGAVPYDEISQYFAEARVLVNTSSNEGFPNTYLQAWCRGVPVVGTFDADGLISKYGLGRHCSTIEELVQAVDEFMKDEVLLASVGEKAIRYVEEHHSPEAVTAQYDKLFMSLYATGRNTP